MGFLQKRSSLLFNSSPFHLLLVNSLLASSVSLKLVTYILVASIMFSLYSYLFQYKIVFSYLCHHQLMQIFVILYLLCLMVGNIYVSSIANEIYRLVNSRDECTVVTRTHAGCPRPRNPLLMNII